jgi:hypothetical protein
MKNKKYDAVELKRALQKKVEEKFASLSEREQLELLRSKFGHLASSRARQLQEHGSLSEMM